MKVLFLIDSLGVGGAERSTLDLCHYLRQNVSEVKIICLRKREEGVQDEAFAAGFDVYFLKGTSLFSHISQINTIYQSFKPDIVHSTLSKSRLRGRLHKLLYFKKHVLVESLVTLPFTQVRIKERRQGRLTVFFHKMLESIPGILSVNRFVAISEDVKKHTVSNLYFIDPSRVSVIFRGRSENKYISQRNSLREHYAKMLGYSDDAIVFIHVGRQDFPKNHLFLIQTFFELLQANSSGKQYHLLCVGRRGDMSEKVDRLVEGHPYKGHVHFLGHRYDVAQLLVQSDIFVFPSLFEGLGGSIIEAKAAGLPLVVSDIAVFRELLIEKQEALFTKLADNTMMVNKLKTLAEDKALRKKMGEQNLESFNEKFHLQKINQQTMQLYQQLLHENSTARN